MASYSFRIQSESMAQMLGLQRRVFYGISCGPTPKGIVREYNSPSGDGFNLLDIDDTRALFELLSSFYFSYRSCSSKINNQVQNWIRSESDFIYIFGITHLYSVDRTITDKPSCFNFAIVSGSNFP